jgi:rubrerythrin
MTHDPVKFTTDLKAIFSGNIRLEQEAESRYQRHIDGYDDPALQKLWAFIKFQEEHHTDEFQARLREQLAKESPER